VFWKRKKPEILQKPSVRFLGEQDGEPERELKAALAAAFRETSGPRRAYLARVDYGDGGQAVALCLASPHDAELLRRAAACFSRLFGTDTSLDILFLSEADERAVGSVCRSFYERAPVS
jgi:hypothetical protein